MWSTGILDSYFVCQLPLQNFAVMFGMKVALLTDASINMCTFHILFQHLEYRMSKSQIFQCLEFDFLTRWQHVTEQEAAVGH